MTGTVTELKDEDGPALDAASSDSFHRETVVGSIILFVAKASDDGGKVIAATRAVLGSTGFVVGAISTDAADDDNTTTLSNAALGMTRSRTDLLKLIRLVRRQSQWLDRRLRGSAPSQERDHAGGRSGRNGRTEINRLRRLIDSTSERNKNDDPSTHGQLTTGPRDEPEDVASGYLISHASAALELVFGSSPPALTGTTAEDLHDKLSKMYAALSSERSFKTAVEADGFFEDEPDRTVAEISDIFDACEISLEIRFDSTAYTCFGVSSESAPIAAEGAASDNTIAHDPFGYRPLKPEPTTLSFAADYAGETLVADENTGNLCSGTFALTVNWGDADSEDRITRTIINLKGVCGSNGNWFQHDSQDAGSIFLSGIDIDGSSTAEFSAVGGTATAPSVRSRYRAGGAEAGGIGGTATISERFVGNGHSEGPLRVLGTLLIAETAANGLDFT